MPAPHYKFDLQSHEILYTKTGVALLTDIDFVKTRIYEQECYIREVTKKNRYKRNKLSEVRRNNKLIRSAQERLDWFEKLRYFLIKHEEKKNMPTKEGVLKAAAADPLI